QRLDFHENLYDTLSHIFIVNTFRAARLTRYRLTNLTNQLLARFIHADNWIARVIGHVVDIQNILHRCYEGRAFLRRDFPVLAEVRFKFIFLKPVVLSWVKLTVQC
ncbi:MAG: hypothetical protein ACQEUB_10570, partial [Thermodesulfobacteriota bacterium]